MLNLDRFSRPLAGEKPSLASLDDLNHLNHKDLVRDYISNWFDETGNLPDIYDILDHMDPLPLDEQMIKQQLNHYGG